MCNVVHYQTRSWAVCSRFPLRRIGVAGLNIYVFFLYSVRFLISIHVNVFMLMLLRYNIILYYARCYCYSVYQYMIHLYKNYDWVIQRLWALPFSYGNACHITSCVSQTPEDGRVCKEVRSLTSIRCADFVNLS